MRTTLAVLAIAAPVVVPGSATAATPDIQQRDELIADADGEGVLEGVESPDWRCSAVLPVEVMLRRCGLDRGASPHPRQSGFPRRRNALVGPHTTRQV